MFWDKKDQPSKKNETHNVLVLKFGTDALGDTVSAEGAAIPDEVAIFKNDTRSVGRAVLTVREDGIYANLMFSNGGLDGLTPKAIVIVHNSVKTDAGRNIVRYEINGVGLERVVKAVEAPVVETPTTITPVQPTEPRDPDEV